MPTTRQQNICRWHAHCTTTEHLPLACPLHDNRTSAAGMPTTRQQNICRWHALYTTTEHLPLACPLHDNRTPASGMPTTLQQNICYWHAFFTTTEHLPMAYPLHDAYGEKAFWLPGRPAVHSSIRAENRSFRLNNRLEEEDSDLPST